MKQLPSFDAADINRLTPMHTAIDALRDCFAGRPTHIARTPLAASDGEFMLMPAVDGDVAGIKLLMIQPKNIDRGRPVIQGTYVLFNADAGEPVALFDGAALTNLRTPAISAVATDGLARQDVRTLGIIGSGPQALGHIDAMLCVRPDVTDIVVASRTSANAAAIVAAITADARRVGGRSVTVGDYAAAAACDVVCTATRSTEPLVDAAMVRPGTHLNAVGAYRTDMRELATDLVAASTVVVDELHAAYEEAGDMVLAIADGGWSWDRLAGDLADVAAGVLRRTSAEEITLFKSSGLAVEDLVIARIVAAEMNLL
ncbi:MAG: Ornithine cyclodeaminase [Ilumatobacteraceae bacterium]|nr:Ornithine cyclodeaminase [Ilumatobacteraceae bacterium]